MVPALTFVFMALTLIISIGLPVGLAIWVMKKFKPGFWAVASGMIVFVVMQLGFRIWIIQLFGITDFGQEFIRNNQILYIILLSLSAGLVEEFGRLFAFGVMLKKRREFRHGLAYGIGHGGIEAVLLVGLSYVTNIIFAILINSGALASLEEMIGEALQPTIDTMTGTASVMFLYAGIERIFAVCLHIALSILVLYGVRKRNVAYTFLAVLLHGAANFGAVMIAQEQVRWLRKHFCSA